MLNYSTIEGCIRQNLNLPMNIDTSIKNKYVLINNNLKPSYSLVSSVVLTEREASIKNTAFKMNRVNKMYILEKNWK